MGCSLRTAIRIRFRQPPLQHQPPIDPGSTTTRLQASPPVPIPNRHPPAANHCRRSGFSKPGDTYYSTNSDINKAHLSLFPNRRPHPTGKANGGQKKSRPKPAFHSYDPITSSRACHLPCLPYHHPSAASADDFLPSVCR